MAARLKYFNKRERCALCGRPDGCSHIHHRFFLCRRTHSQAEAPAGYKFLGLAPRNNDWGMFILESDYVHRAYTAKKPDAFPPNYQPKLSIFERDIQYQKLFEQLDCTEPFRSWLRDLKGIPDEAIEHFGFKSFTLDTAVSNVPECLPGYNFKRPDRLKPWGRSNEKPQGGLLVPVKNIQGQILACQIVAAGRCKAELINEVWEGERYKWWVTHSGQTQLPESHENAQPMGFYRPPVVEDADTLYLCEGFVKAAWTAWHHQIQVLGAAGANFTMIQLVETLALGGFKRAVLLPDAGMLLNVSIGRNYFKLNEFMEAIGVPLAVLYWGQGESKDLGDIDELEVGSESPLRFPVLR